MSSENNFSCCSSGVSATDLEAESDLQADSSKESSAAAEDTVVTSEGRSEEPIVSLKKEECEENKPSGEVSKPEMMAAAADKHTTDSEAQPRPNRSKFWGEARTVILHREPNQSFGISIVGGRVEVSQKGGLPGTGNTVSGIFIKSVLPNSPAGKSGMMNMGDRVISVNEHDLREATHEQAVHYIKNATNPVKFVVQSLHSFSPQHQMVTFGGTSKSDSSQGRTERSKKSAGEEDTTKKTSPAKSASARPQAADYENANVVVEKHDIHQEQPASEPHVTEEKVEATISTEGTPAKEATPSSVESVAHSTSEHEHETTPEAPEAPQTSGAYEEAVQSEQKAEVHVPETPGTPAKEATPSSVESVAHSTSEHEHETTPEAPEAPQTSGAYEEALQSEQNAEKVQSSERTPSPIKLAPKNDENREAERAKIERGSAAYLTRLPDDPEEEDRFFYTKNKIARKYGELPGDALLLRLEKVPPGGLGLSLAGNRDRDKMSVFVVAIRSTCPLPIKVGDELLEVNGKVLLGLSHLNASAKIRECCEEGKLELLLLRRFDALNEMAIRPEPKLSRSRTSPVCAESGTVDTTYIPGKRQTSTEPAEPSPPSVGGFILVIMSICVVYLQSLPKKGLEL
ncbi:unnamed protein product [Toxocara canis]|uniref:PDZ domain-containing protein n=1 Tax=Toxocara canis TaxID=6265 RepID=A0A3P7INH8_TOXCA|nr:unnamed protein product [Toxocara canis]